MAAKSVTVKREWCVISVRTRGLDRMARVHGPFTHREANTVAFYRTREDGEECAVEKLEPMCEHNSWILEDH